MLSELRHKVVSMIVSARSATITPPWKQKLFGELIEMAKFQVGDMDRQQIERLKKNTLGELLGCQVVIRRSSDPSPEEANSVRADIVEALVLAGELEAAEKIARDITTEGYDNAVSARLEIIKGWARRDPNWALHMALHPMPIDPELEDTEFEDIGEKEDQQEHGLREILKVIVTTEKPDYVVRWITQILPKHVNHRNDENGPCFICASQDILAGTMAAAGNIKGAREIAKRQRIPFDQVPTWLAVYKTSRAPEDLEAARAIAQKDDYEPYQDWLRIAEATHEPQDIAKARTEVMNIPNEEMSKGWTADFSRNDKLLTLAKISGDPNDVAAAREGILANPRSVYSLYMELCQITRDPNDFALLLESTKREYGHDTDRYSALACIAGITQKETDFMAATKAALEINDPARGVSTPYLRGSSLAELAQILCGKTKIR